MDRKAPGALAVVTLLAASTPLPAGAQPQADTSAEAANTLQSAATDFALSPKYAQNEEQQWFDRYDCDSWAKAESGYDRESRQTGPAGQRAAEEYRRAMTACLEQHGYEVRYSPPPLPPSPTPYQWLAPTWTEPRQLRYGGFSVQAGGGYTLAAGSTADYVRNGVNAAAALMWFPSAALPLGVQLEGSYTWLKPASQLLALDNVGYNRGERDVYGGDVDLRLNLAGPPSRQQLYLVAGVGWYRIFTLLQKVSEVRVCGTNFCGLQGSVVAQEQDISPWESSWNAGLGWEIALDSHTSFYVEARYRRIQSPGRAMQLVPIWLGLRF